MLTQTRLKHLLKYNKNTGVFTWKVDHGKCKRGQRAGRINSHGYRGIKIDYVEHKEHRLAWLYVKGNVPKQIDHEDRSKDNNKWNNLRDLNQSKNNVNSKLHKSNKSGHRNISWHKQSKTWRLSIWRDKVLQLTSHFKSLDKAIQTRDKFIKSYGY